MKRVVGRTGLVQEAATSGSAIRDTRREPAALRRKQILQAAAKLFAVQGYEATGVDEIGHEIGITGPAIYRHFPGKEAVLVAALQEGAAHMLTGVKAITTADLDPMETLHRLVRNLLDVVLDRPELLAVYHRERAAIPPAVRAELDRSDRLHVEEWVHALLRARADLDEPEARVTIQGVMRMLAGAGLDRSGLSRPRLREVYSSVAVRALGVSP